MTSAVVLSKRRKESRGRVRIGRTYLPWSKEIKYLGVYHDRRLTCRTHAQTVSTCKLGKLIINAYLLPAITYIALVRGYLATVHKRKLQSVLDRLPGLSLIHI